MDDNNQHTLIGFLGVALIVAIVATTLLLGHRDYLRHIEAMTSAGFVEKPTNDANGNHRGVFWSKP